MATSGWWVVEEGAHPSAVGGCMEYLIDCADPSGDMVEQLGQLGDLSGGEMFFHLDEYAGVDRGRPGSTGGAVATGGLPDEGGRGRGAVGAPSAAGQWRACRSEIRWNRAGPPWVVGVRSRLICAH
jgi:hypothetical protein